MASRKTAAPIQQSDIKLAGKSKKDAATLARFVKQEGRGAIPLLDDVLAQGSLVMRRAAITQLGQLDPRKAEKFVRDGLKAAGAARKKGSKDRDELVTWLALIGSPSSLQSFLDEGGQAGDLDLESATIAALHGLVADEVRGLDIDGVRQRLMQVGLLDEGEMYAFAITESDEARALARALLGHGDAQARSWGATMLSLIDGIRALDEIRRAGVALDLETLRRLCVGQPEEVKIELLAPFLGSTEHRARVLGIVTGKLDPRWFPLLEPYVDDPEVTNRLAHGGHPGTLARLRAAADGSTFDRATQRACYALGLAADAQATPILLRWLADPVGRQSSPMLLNALGECAGLDAIATIERLSANEPTRATFYGHAIASIRQRRG